MVVYSTKYEMDFFVSFFGLVKYEIESIKYIEKKKKIKMKTKKKKKTKSYSRFAVVGFSKSFGALHVLRIIRFHNL